MKLTKQHKNILFSILLSLITFILSFNFLTFEQSALLSIIVLMIILWTNEGLPLAVVSLFPIIFFPLLNILTIKETTVNYANPIIYLFLGGFLIAIAVEKTGLHKIITNRILSIFPNSATGIIYALIFTSGLLSSILSNTTTALLLLPIALFLTEDSNLKMRFTLAIAYGASIGGILTPIGTPPNLIFIGLLEKLNIATIPFLKWVAIVSPLVFLMFIVVGYVLSRGLKGITIKGDFSNKTLNKEHKKVLYVIFGLIILLLINSPIKPYYNGLGISESVILLGAGLLLFMPPFSILNWMKDKNNIPFRIMFLFGAGFSIAASFTNTGLADILANYLISYSYLPLVLFILLVATLITFTTEITSNTALISIMLPILYIVATKSNLDPTLIMLVATICSSYAFMLPIATPPNAIAMSSGNVNVKIMAKYGIVFNIVGITFITIIANLLWKYVI